jgi:hypothetical protein
MNAYTMSPLAQNAGVSVHIVHDYLLRRPCAPQRLGRVRRYRSKRP